MILSTTGLNFFSKYYSELLINVIRLEFGRGLFEPFSTKTNFSHIGELFNLSIKKF